MKILAVFGTRPEAVKMARVVPALRSRGLDVRVCLSGQHRDMVTDVIELFGLTADFDANLMEEDQEPGDLAARAMSALSKLFDVESPDLVLVQGDTTTAFTASLAAFYKRIPSAHIEAGLRTSTRWSPFPEEMTRRLIGQVAELHFAPTDRAATALASEGVAQDRILVTGNTVIDALQWLTAQAPSSEVLERVNGIAGEAGRLILVTAHRRENFGPPLRAICEAIADIVRHNPDVNLVYPVHLNPRVQEIAHEVLGDTDRVRLTDPLPYETFVWLMKRAYLIVTDSGGLQEEGPALGKPVLVVREETERPEGVAEGTARVVGIDKTNIVSEVQALLDDSQAYERMARSVMPYGDGRASERIASAIEDFLSPEGNR